MRIRAEYNDNNKVTAIDHATLKENLESILAENIDYHYDCLNGDEIADQIINDVMDEMDNIGDEYINLEDLEEIDAPEINKTELDKELVNIYDKIDIINKHLEDMNIGLAKDILCSLSNDMLNARITLEGMEG